MARWNSLFVNEMSHAYKRLTDTGNVEDFKEYVDKMCKSYTGDFEQAYFAGLAEYVSKYNNITLNVDLEAKITPPAYPELYLTPKFLPYKSEYDDTVIDEFKKHGVMLRDLGDAV